MAYSYAATAVPDLDQQWNSLPGHGANHCVPTAAMNWMYWYRGKGIGQAVKYEPSQHADHRPRNIRALGDCMGTDAEDGTSAGNAFDGLVDWLGERGLFGVVVDRRARDNEHVSYTSIRNMLQASGNVVVSMGRYHLDDGEFERDSAHAMTLVRLVRTDAGTITIGVHNPNDGGNRSNQSPTRVQEAGLVEQVRNIEGDRVKVLRWGNDSSPYRFIDGWLAIIPVFMMTSLAAGFVTTYRADIGTGAIGSDTLALPFRGEIADLALDLPNMAAAVIDRSTGEVWRLALADRSWSKLPGVRGVQRITYAGRQRRLYVAQGDGLHAYGEDGQRTGSLALGTHIDALGWDARADRLVVGSSATRRLLSVGPTMRLLGSVETPLPPGTGQLSLSVDDRDGSITVARAGSPDVRALRWAGGGDVASTRFTLAGAASASGVQVDRTGRLFAAVDGRAGGIDGEGRRDGKASAARAFDGLPVGASVALARSTSILDPARSAQPRWRLG